MGNILKRVECSRQTIDKILDTAQTSATFQASLYTGLITLIIEAASLQNKKRIQEKITPKSKPITLQLYVKSRPVKIIYV